MIPLLALVAAAVTPMYPVAAPAGSQIAWVEGSTSRIRVADADGSQAHATGPTFVQGIGAIAWTKRGFVVDSNYTLFLVSPAGGRTQLAVVGDQSFSVGGSRVAVGGGQGTGPVTVVDLATRKVVRLGSPTQANGEPSLSPDGRRVAWVTSGGISIASSSGGTARTLVANAQSPSWSPDGRSIAYLTVGDRGLDLHVMRADGSGARLLVRRVGGSLVWSPDSRRIAFAPQRIDLVDVASRRVTRSGNMGRAGGLAWSRDGSSLYVVTRPLADERASNNCTNLWRLSSTTLTGRIAVRGCP